MNLFEIEISVNMQGIRNVGGVQWRAVKYLPNGTWIAQSRLYIHFLIIGTNPTTGYVLWFDEWLTVGLMKFYTNSRASLTYTGLEIMAN